MIDRFDGDYAFLSNFYECPVEFADLKFGSSEAAFQAMKTPLRNEQYLFVDARPREAKIMGRSIGLRANWEQIKDTFMYLIVLAKFTQNADLRKQLLATGDEELVEGNYWHDTYWGVCDGVGQNKLGKILMRVREELR